MGRTDVIDRSAPIQSEIEEALKQLDKGEVKKYPGVYRVLNGMKLMNVDIGTVLDGINLGFLIYGLNPYENKAGKPFAFEIDFEKVEMETKPGVWKFKYGERYVERALRIPYYYTPKALRDVLKVGVTEPFAVTDHFLVGYEGGTGY